jgi:hypothetical protein
MMGWACSLVTYRVLAVKLAVILMALNLPVRLLEFN